MTSSKELGNFLRFIALKIVRLLNKPLLGLQVEVAVDVGLAAEVPDHVRAFDLPGVPHLVGTDVVFS